MLKNELVLTENVDAPLKTKYFKDLRYSELSAFRCTNIDIIFIEKDVDEIERKDLIEMYKNM